MNIAVFPGTFDPITLGHMEIVKRALPIFDKIIIAIGINDSKKTLFSLEQRVKWIEEVFRHEEKVVTDTFLGLPVDFCKSVESRFLLRGLRNAADFDYEKTISQLNHVLGEDIETIFLISRPKYSHISSTIVKEIIKAKGDASVFLPREVII